MVRPKKADSSTASKAANSELTMRAILKAIRDTSKSSRDPNRCLPKLTCISVVVEHLVKTLEVTEIIPTNTHSQDHTITNSNTPLTTPTTLNRSNLAIRTRTPSHMTLTLPLTRMPQKANVA